MVKMCTVCNTEKELDCFHKLKLGKFGVASKCKDCKKQYENLRYENNKKHIICNQKEYYKKNKKGIIEYAKKYQKDNKQAIKEKREVYYEENKVKILEYSKSYRNNNKEYQKEYQKKYRENNKEKLRLYRESNKQKIKEYYKNNKEIIIKNLNEYQKKRKKNDKLFKLVYNIRNIIGNALRKKGYKKRAKTANILGCQYEDFKIHIESQFEPWMGWDNYGKYNGEFNFGWDLDHIVPLATAKTENDIIKLNKYTNLQPLCSKINRDIKRDKIYY